MAIQFQCGFCKQPIEIDDEFASGAVGCPYCKKTVTAPAHSTLDSIPHIPMASAATGVAPNPTTGPYPPAMTPPMSRNTVAIVAFALACAMLAAMFATGAVIATHANEMRELADIMQGTGTDFKSQLDAMNSFLSSREGVPPTWLIAFSILQLLTWMFWLAALVCGLIGIRRIARRRFAIAALSICGGYLVLLCANIFV